MLSAVRAGSPTSSSPSTPTRPTRSTTIDLLQSSTVRLHYIEQPLHWDDLVDHAQLATQLRRAVPRRVAHLARPREGALDLGRARSST
jgi:hypothetical protein